MEGKFLINVLMRGFQFLWALLVMSLVGNIIAISSGPGIINYAMFCSVFAMVSLFYLIPVTFKESFTIHSAIPFTLDLLNTIFWFCGGVALAAYLHVHSCSNMAYVDSNFITRGSRSRCREAQASTAFLWFGFAAFFVSTVFTGMGLSGGRVTRSGGIRRGPPAMSQV